MKRSLMASALLAGVLVVYAPVSEAQTEAGIQSTQLTGQFSAGARFLLKSTDIYGFPLVGYACPAHQQTCDNPRSGLLYNPNTINGFSHTFQVGTAQLSLGGALLRFDNGNFFFWGAQLASSPFDKDDADTVVSQWNLGYQSQTMGAFRIGDSMGLRAFTSLRDLYSGIARRVDISSTESFLVFPGASSGAAPFSYSAPGFLYSSNIWNGMSFDFSMGASVKQHRSLQDKNWVNAYAGVDEFRGVDDKDTTPQRAIQWAVAFNGYFRGIEGFLKPLAGQWMFSYAQSQQLNNSAVRDFRFKRAAHVSFASVYLPLRSVNVVDLQWSQNTGTGFNKMLLSDLGIQSNFEGVYVNSFFGSPLGQIVKPVPYWNAGVSWTTWHYAGGSSGMSWSFGYTRTQTYGYDFSGLSLIQLSKVSSNLFGDQRFNSVFENPFLTLVYTKYIGLTPDQAAYPVDYELSKGKLLAQSIYVGARYRYVSPYTDNLKVTLSGQLIYAKATLQLKGTPQQVAKGYSTKPFDLGTDLLAVFGLNIDYSF